MKVANNCLCDAMQAIERGEGDSDDWHASKDSLIQARSDEKTIQEVLGKIYAKQHVSSYAVILYTLQSCCMPIAIFPASNDVHMRKYALVQILATSTGSSCACLMR